MDHSHREANMALLTLTPFVQRISNVLTGTWPGFRPGGGQPGAACGPKISPTKNRKLLGIDPLFLGFLANSFFIFLFLV